MKIRPPPRPCSQCGAEFTPVNQELKDLRTCSDVCLVAFRAAHARRALRPGNTAKQPIRNLGFACADCGAPVVRRNHTAKYCMECSSIRIARGQLRKPSPG